MKVLVTGGAGFIGSHTTVALQEAGHQVAIIDDFRNSKPTTIDKIAEITGTAPSVFDCDVVDRIKTELVFAKFEPDAVIHFAALKAVGESVDKPLDYHHNNLGGLLSVLAAADKYQTRNFVFSSSATVYGAPQSNPVKEDHPHSSLNPYGSTKIIGEQILNDYSQSNPYMHITALRYFNPVGAHPSGLIGEDPEGLPNNLMPYVMRVADGRLDELTVFGDDYDTPDGTGIRDFIHVLDVADGHLAALEKAPAGFFACNLGTGKGYSVKEVIVAYEKACGKKIPFSIGPRRAGDSAECVADATLAHDVLGWCAKYDLDDMCNSSWNFAVKNKQ